MTQPQTRSPVSLTRHLIKDPTKAGKLQLMYEANLMSLLIEQAGGAATDGRMRMLDIAPTHLHQRVPVFLGSKDEVEIATRYHLRADHSDRMLDRTVSISSGVTL